MSWHALRFPSQIGNHEAVVEGVGNSSGRVRFSLRWWRQSHPPMRLSLAALCAFAFTGSVAWADFAVFEGSQAVRNLGEEDSSDDVVRVYEIVSTDTTEFAQVRLRRTEGVLTYDIWSPGIDKVVVKDARKTGKTFTVFGVTFSSGLGVHGEFQAGMPETYFSFFQKGQNVSVSLREGSTVLFPIRLQGTQTIVVTESAEDERSSLLSEITSQLNLRLELSRELNAVPNQTFDGVLDFIVSKVEAEGYGQ